MKPLTRAALHAIIKDIFAGAAGRLRLPGESYAAQADLLTQASTHLASHTAGSHLADGGADLRTIRDNLRHALARARPPHLHTTDDERHRETEQKHRIDWLRGD